MISSVVIFLVGFMTVYLIGMLLAYGLTLGAYYKRWESIHSVEESITSWPALWVKDFDYEWKKIERERVQVLRFAQECMWFSWLGVVIELSEHGCKYPPMFDLPPMPDKEQMRLIVNSLKLKEET